MPQGVQQPTTVESFLKTILRSGLMDRTQLQEAIRRAPRDARSDAKLLADYLVRQGKLSRFQSKKLLEGTGRGLVLRWFQVLAPIGRGGMGTVYLARDTRYQDPHLGLRALKVLPPKTAREEERLRRRFLREMEMCQRVAHPHLVFTYEIDAWGGVYYIAMEFIPGKSLFRIINDSGPMPAPRAARLFSEICAALDECHHQGIIHRDIKPSNVLVTPHDHAKVLDLGLALMRGETGTREVIGGQHYVVGTMDYIAPEQADDPTKVDARSDIYALGCSLYFVLTGQQPFPGGTNRDKIRRHRTEEPRPIGELNSNVPAALAALVHEMMAKDPDKRPRNAHDVQIKLERWATGEPRLPLDRPTDSTYELAVQEIEDREVPPDISEEVIPLEGVPVPEVDEDASVIDAVPVDETSAVSPSVVIADEVPPSAPIIPVVPTARAPLKRKSGSAIPALRTPLPPPQRRRLTWLYVSIAVFAFVVVCGLLVWLVR